MFGYITIDKENLTAEEYTVYKAIYCSLCKTMGKEYSLFSRFILSYDCTFFALLIMSIQDNVPCFNKDHCVFNPLKKCVLCENEVALSLSAALSISSAYYKLIDNAKHYIYIENQFFVTKPFSEDERDDKIL